MLHYVGDSWQSDTSCCMILEISIPDIFVHDLDDLDWKDVFPRCMCCPFQVLWHQSIADELCETIQFIQLGITLLGISL